MPKITERIYFNGTEERLDRLGLRPLWDEVEGILTHFQLLVKEERDANGGAAVRKIIDRRFEAANGWKKKQTGDVDWSKCHIGNGTKVCLGVEVQFSARSDMLIVDVHHLRDQITTGKLDVGVIVVPSDRLSTFLTDRGPSFTDAVKAMERARASDLPLAVLALEHDGPDAGHLEPSCRLHGQLIAPVKLKPPSAVPVPLLQVGEHRGGHPGVVGLRGLPRRVRPRFRLPRPSSPQHARNAVTNRRSAVGSTVSGASASATVRAT